MKVYGFGRFIIVKTVYKLARKRLYSRKTGRGPKRYRIESRIAVLAWVVLGGKSYRRELDDLKRMKVYKQIGLKCVPSPASVSRWKRRLINMVSLPITQSFYRLARARKARKMLAIVDGTGLSIGRSSDHYLRRIRKRRQYLLLTALYSPDVDAFFDVVVSSDSYSELEAFRNYLLGVLVNSCLFWGVIADKRYDSSDIIDSLERHGIVSMIPARRGKLEPKDGPRWRSWMNYETFRALNGCPRNLIESAFSSLKALANAVITTRSWETRICDVLIMVLAYNVARRVELGIN